MSKIGLLDDNNDFCTAIQELLSNYHESYAFADTTIFLEKIKSEKYDLALIDLSIQPISSLKIYNGCDLIGYLKSTLSELPILVLFTGWISGNLVQEGRKICPLADGFIGKNLDLDNILQEINNLITSKNSQKVEKEDV
jgi:CheY-like chemotaxis protein